MSETLTQRVLAAVLDDKAIDDELVRDLALSSDAHGELVRIAVVLARLPGNGARVAEVRLDGLLDEVSSVAASESRVQPASPLAVRTPRPQTHRRNLKPRLLVAGGAVAATAAYLALYLTPSTPSTPSSPSTPPSPAIASPAPAPAPSPAPALAPSPAPATAVEPARRVAVEIRVIPATATITLDGVQYEGNPYAARHALDTDLHRIDVTAPGYVSKRMHVMFQSDVTVDISLERIAPRENVAAAVPDAAPTSPPTLPPTSLPQAPTQKVDVPDAGIITLRPGVPPVLPFGKIRIATSVPDYEVVIDGVYVGKTPLDEPVAVKVGRRVITFTRAGHAVERWVVDVSQGDTVQVKPAAAVDAIDASGGRKPVRPIDPANVYEKP